MSRTMARLIKATAEWICSMRVLVARDGKAADAPPGGFERHHTSPFLVPQGEAPLAYTKSR